MSTPALIPLDRRKHVRTGMALPAMFAVHVGDPPHPCTVVDLSPGGGRLKLDDDVDVPDTFVLLMTPNGSVRRVCQVVWRRENYIGVAFQGRFDHIQ